MSQPQYTPSLAPEHWTSWSPDVADAFMVADNHNRFIGASYAAHGDDWIEMSLPWREDLVETEDGALGPGVLIALLDLTCSRSVWTRIDGYRPHATLDLRVDHLRQPRPRAALRAFARCHRLTRHLAYVSGSAHDGNPDDPVATATGVFISTLGYFE